MKKCNQKIARQIKTMVILDLRMRKKADKGKAFDFSVDKENTRKVKIMIRHHGWPTISLVGKRASWGAWLLVQHADHDRRFQKQCLKLMEKIWAKNPNDIAAANIAFLKDRTLINQRKKQLFGTQFFIDKKGSMVPRPIKEPKRLEQRRIKYDLPPFKDYLESARKYKPIRAK